MEANSRLDSKICRKKGRIGLKRAALNTRFKFQVCSHQLILTVNIIMIILKLWPTFTIPIYNQLRLINLKMFKRKKLIHQQGQLIHPSSLSSMCKIQLWVLTNSVNKADLRISMSKFHCLKNRKFFQIWTGNLRYNHLLKTKLHHITKRQSTMNTNTKFPNP